MWTVKWKDHYTKTWQYAVHDKAPNKGKKIKFPKRQKAVQWVRNHRWLVNFPVEVLGPDHKETIIGVGKWVNKQLKNYRGSIK